MVVVGLVFDMRKLCGCLCGCVGTFYGGTSDVLE